MTFVLVCNKVIGGDDNEPLLVWDRDSDVHYFVIVEGIKDSLLSVRKMQLFTHPFQEFYQHLLVSVNWQIRKTLSFFFVEHISHLVVEIGLYIFIQWEIIGLRLESFY